MSALQLELAEEAARIMFDQGINDFRLAKEKAAENFGLSAAEALPSNLEIEQAIRDVAWAGDESNYQSQLAMMRRESLQAMKLLAEFEPRIVGGALNGAITPHQPVQLHVHSDDPEAVGFKLERSEIPFDWQDKRLKFARSGYRLVPVCGFIAGKVIFEVFILSLRDLRQPPLSLVTGKTMERAKAKKLQQLLSVS